MITPSEFQHLLSDPQPARRLKALTSLESLADPAIAQMIVNLRKDPDPAIRFQVERLLSRYAPDLAAGQVTLPVSQSRDGLPPWNTGWELICHLARQPVRLKMELYRNLSAPFLFWGMVGAGVCWAIDRSFSSAALEEWRLPMLAACGYAGLLFFIPCIYRRLSGFLRRTPEFGFNLPPSDQEPGWSLLFRAGFTQTIPLFLGIMLSFLIPSSRLWILMIFLMPFLYSYYLIVFLTIPLLLMNRGSFQDPFIFSMVFFTNHGDIIKSLVRPGLFLGVPAFFLITIGCGQLLSIFPGSFRWFVSAMFAGFVTGPAWVFYRCLIARKILEKNAPEGLTFS